MKRDPLCFDAETVADAMKAWLPKLAPLIERMAAGIDASAIEATADAFIVARNFPRRNITSRAADYEPVVDALKRAIDGLTDESLIERVDALADTLARTPGLTRQRRGEAGPVRPISAASKFVWTACPRVGIIYDGRAWQCLNRQYPENKRGEYGKFVRAVRDEQPKHREFIESLVERAGPELSRAPWIRGKIFDFCLYAHAGRATQATAISAEGEV